MLVYLAWHRWCFKNSLLHVNVNIAWLYYLKWRLPFYVEVLQCAITIVAKFNEVQCGNMNWDVLDWDCASLFVSNFMRYISAKIWQNWMTLDKDITKIKRVKFYRTWCILCLWWQVCIVPCWGTQDNGSVLWQSTVGSPVFSSPAPFHAGCIVASVNTCVYAFSHHGHKVSSQFCVIHCGSKETCYQFFVYIITKWKAQLQDPAGAIFYFIEKTAKFHNPVMLFVILCWNQKSGRTGFWNLCPKIWIEFQNSSTITPMIDLQYWC